MFIEVLLFQKLPLPWKILHLTELSCSGVCPGFRKCVPLRKKPPEKSTGRKMTTWKKSPLTKRWKMKTSFYYQYMIVVWHMKMVVQWVSQNFPDGECTPAVFLPYMLIMIFKKSLPKYSLSCSSKLFFRWFLFAIQKMNLLILPFTKEKSIPSCKTLRGYFRVIFPRDVFNMHIY